MTDAELRISCKALVWAIEYGDAEEAARLAAHVRSELAADEAERERQMATEQWLARAAHWASDAGRADIAAFAAAGHFFPPPDITPYLTLREAAWVLDWTVAEVETELAEELSPNWPDAAGPRVSRLVLNSILRSMRGLAPFSPPRSPITDTQLPQALAEFEDEYGYPADEWLWRWTRGRIADTTENQARAWRAGALLNADTAAAGGHR